MKTIVKGMVLLLAGASFIACSKDVSFDENALKDAERAKAQAEVAQMIANYESGFVKHFGPIANGQKWGFDRAKASSTRTAVTSTNDLWYIPNNFLYGEQNKNGINCGNLVEAETQNPGANPKAVFSNDLNIDFSSFWLQHIENPNNKNIIMELQAWNSVTHSWEKVENFEWGKNNTDFEISVGRKYTYTGLNKSAANATLMTGMGGTACDRADENGSEEAIGKRFRWIENRHIKGNQYQEIPHYTYKFLTYTHTPTFPKNGPEITETFLCVEISTGDFWGIKIGHADPASEVLKEAGVIFCEDMGQEGDYDFNDVVFEARMFADNHFEINVLAAGATLEIKIDGIVVDLGVNMANTGVNEATKTQTITIPAKSDGWPKYDSIKDIPVEVTSRGGAVYALTAEDDAVPQKVCAPLGTLWAKEYISIEEAYPSFKTYVNSNTPNLWTDNYVPENVFVF